MFWPDMCHGARSSSLVSGASFGEPVPAGVAGGSPPARPARNADIRGFSNCKDPSTFSRARPKVF